LLQTLPQGQPAFTLAGSSIVIASQTPDVAPGAIPMAFGNWTKTYTIVDRKGVTLQVSSGWCTRFKFEARIGGATTCPNAARLLRVR
jgi:HK97 family phage major capsid protein